MQREKNRPEKAAEVGKNYLLLQFTIVYFCRKLRWLKIIKHNFKKWKLLKFELLRLRATHSLASFLPFAIVICCWAKGAWFISLLQIMPKHLLKHFFSCSVNTSPNTLKTWLNLNCFITRKNSDVQSSAAQYVSVSRSISSKEFGFRDRSDRHICFQSGEQLQY